MAGYRLMVIIDDDTNFSRILKLSFERRGYSVMLAAGAEDLGPILELHTPVCAIVDLKLRGASGLECIQTLHACNPAMAILVLTGYASIATAVESIKLGACNYLTKPAGIDDIENALLTTYGGNVNTPITARHASIKNVEWERIHQMLIDTDFNISETARQLGMHRRTLARKLTKDRVK